MDVPLSLIGLTWMVGPFLYRVESFFSSKNGSIDAVSSFVTGTGRPMDD